MGRFLEYVDSLANQFVAGDVVFHKDMESRRFVVLKTADNSAVFTGINLEDGSIDGNWRSSAYYLKTGQHLFTVDAMWVTVHNVMAELKEDYDCIHDDEYDEWKTLFDMLDDNIKVVKVIEPDAATILA